MCGFLSQLPGIWLARSAFRGKNANRYSPLRHAIHDIPPTGQATFLSDLPGTQKANHEHADGRRLASAVPMPGVWCQVRWRNGDADS